MGDGKRDVEDHKKPEGQPASADGPMHSEIYVTPALDPDKIFARGKDLDNAFKGMSDQVQKAEELTAKNGLTPEAKSAWEGAIKAADTVDQGKLAGQIKDLTVDLEN